MINEKAISEKELGELRKALSGMNLTVQRLTEWVIRITSNEGNMILQKTENDSILEHGKAKVSLSKNDLRLLVERPKGEYKTKSLFITTK